MPKTKYFVIFATAFVFGAGVAPAGNAQSNDARVTNKAARPAAAAPT